MKGHAASYQISKTFTFAASHRLAGLTAGHKCARLHGHNWQVTVTLTALGLDSAGMVVDYAELAPFGRWIDETLDHRHLGAGDCYDSGGQVTDPAVFAFNPTAENLARALLVKATELLDGDGWHVARVEVRETVKTSAVAT